MRLDGTENEERLYSVVVDYVHCVDPASVVVRESGYENNPIPFQSC
jgi:hypothetical protein